jgi:hypothetical protein
MRWLTGERALAVVLGALGLLFAVKSRELKYMDEFAPGAGFLPFWLGLIVVGLVIVFVLTTRGRAAGEREGPRAGRKVFAVGAGLVACVVFIEWIGFAAAIAAYILYLARWIENRRWGLSLGLAAGTTLALYVVFRVWLGVPLPRGPWGF